MEQVAVIGAGPVGLFTALSLAKAGIKVTVFEADTELNQNPRALAYFPVVLNEFEKLGILEDIKTIGDCNYSGVRWRDAHGILASIVPPSGVLGCVHLGQKDVSDIIVSHATATENIDLRFGHRLVDIVKGEDDVLLRFEHASQPVEYRFKYAIGTDGGKSTVRKLLGIKFEGTTWDEQLISANIYYDLEQYGWTPANYIVDPDHWSIVAKYQRGHHWRVATGFPVAENTTVDREQLMEKLRQTCRHILPGNVDEMQILQLSPYRIHQRCVETLRVGNILLAGDSAHLVNPIGGLGLLTGFMDAAHLSRALIDILNNGAEKDPVLNEYSDVRRQKFLDITNPTSIQNLQRLKSTDPAEDEKRKQFFARLNDRSDPFAMQHVLTEFQISSTAKAA